jgi:hypothetical protein
MGSAMPGDAVALIDRFPRILTGIYPNVGAEEMPGQEGRPSFSVEKEAKRLSFVCWLLSPGANG